MPASYQLYALPSPDLLTRFFICCLVNQELNKSTKAGLRDATGTRSLTSVAGAWLTSHRPLPPQFTPPLPAVTQPEAHDATRCSFKRGIGGPSRRQALRLGREGRDET